MSRTILCIDDEPDRYRDLLEVHDGTVLLTEMPAAVDLYLREHDEQRQRIWGVCLDHDMTHTTGLVIAKRLLIQRGIPVAITSMNPHGAEAIEAVLREWGTPCRRIPCIEARQVGRMLYTARQTPNFVGKVLDFFHQVRG